MRLMTTIWLASILMVLASCGDVNVPTGSFDILIENGSVVDGTGRDVFDADILIRADTIAYVGNVDKGKIDVAQIFDAGGKVITPGFIDAHAHGDPTLDAEFENFLRMGVTTICLGQDGFSHPSTAYSLWMDSVDAAGLGVNVISFMGHSTLRLLSGAGYEQNPTTEQLDSMRLLLAKAMEDGAFGMSTGLEYTPGYYAQDEELAALAKVVGEKNGIIMSHMRNEDDDQIEKSLDELLAQGEFAPVHISHFKVVYGQGPERADYLLSKLDSARSAGVTVTADVYPYTASYTGIGIVFPDWAKAPNDYDRVKATRRKELEAFIRERVTKRNGPDATLFGNGEWKGMTLTEVADSLGLPFEKVLIDKVGPEGASGAYFVMNEALQATLIQDSLVCISSDGSPTMHHPRGYGTFAKIIRQYVNETHQLTLTDAVRKMTSLPASILGLEDRGVIRIGAKADILVFDPLKVIDKATYEEPHQFAEGFDLVLVNGQVAVPSKNTITSRNGIFLRK